MKTQQEKAVAYFRESYGFTIFSQTNKYIVLRIADFGVHIYIGKHGAIRYGRNLKNSVDIRDKKLMENIVLWNRGQHPKQLERIQP